MRLFRRGSSVLVVPEPVALEPIPWTWLDADIRRRQVRAQLDERFGPTLNDVRRDWIIDGMHFSGTLSEACDRAANHCRRMREVAPWFRSSVALARPGQSVEVVST